MSTEEKTPVHPYESTDDLSRHMAERTKDLKSTTFADAHAAGYAAAVADIRHLAETMATRLRSGDLANLLLVMDSGVHVGAAKKGVSNG